MKLKGRNVILKWCRYESEKVQKEMGNLVFVRNRPEKDWEHMWNKGRKIFF